MLEPASKRMLLPHRRDCRADAVALGAWERWHRRKTVTERALRKQTLRPSPLCELVEFARSANFRVCGTRYCPARAATGGHHLRPKVPPGGVPLAIQSVVLDPLQRLRLQSARRQPRNQASSSRPDFMKLKPLVKTSAFDYRTRLVASLRLRCILAGVCLRKSAEPVRISARRKEQLSPLVLRTRVRNPAEPRLGSANSFVCCRENGMRC